MKSSLSFPAGFAAILGVMLLGGCLGESQPDSGGTMGKAEFPVFTEKVFAEPDGNPGPLLKRMGPGAILPEKSRMGLSKGLAAKIFDLQVPEDGQFHLGAWIDGVKDAEYDVLLDDRLLPESKLRLAKDGWQTAFIASAGSDRKRIPLSKGKHTLTVRGRGKNVPNVEFLGLGTIESQVTQPDAAYEEYLQGLKDQAKPGDKSSPALAKTAAQQDPLISYYHSLNSPVTYTWYTMMYLEGGRTAWYYTGNRTANCDPVMHLFQVGGNGYTWSNDDGQGNLNSVIHVTIQESGWYYLLVHAYGASTTGTVTIYDKTTGPIGWPATVMASNAAVAGTYHDLNGSTQNPVNYFTARQSNGIDTRLWLMNTRTGTVDFFNDDYPYNGNFYWGLNSRVLTGSTRPPTWMLISAYGSSNPSGTADVYGRVAIGESHNTFPSLHPNDAMFASLASQAYNCINWAGGGTSTFIWPPFAGNAWYVPNDPLQSFHNYYGNRCANGGSCPRFGTATPWTYGNYNTSSGAIALWYNSTALEYTHASVTKPGNNHPHGYDWESKAGQWYRLLHPQHALASQAPGGYGAIVGYYQPTSGPQEKTAASGRPVEAMNEQESIRAGLSVLEDPIRFDNAENAKLAGLKEKIPAEVRKDFTKRLAAWQATFSRPELAIHSNPAAYRRTAEYQDFASLCESLGKGAWPLYLEEFEKRNPIVGYSLIELILPGNEAILDAAVQEWTRNQVDEHGRFRIFSNENTRMRFARSLLRDL